jgi:hypothetical protein
LGVLRQAPSGWACAPDTEPFSVCRAGVFYRNKKENAGNRNYKAMFFLSYFFGKFKINQVQHAIAIAAYVL